MAKAGQQYDFVTHNLWDLCFRGDVKAAKKAIDRGVDVNVRNKVGWTPLHAASRGGQVRVSELLLARGADVDAKDNVRIPSTATTSLPLSASKSIACASLCA